MIRFTVPGQPVGKGRPRIGKIGTHARMFTPAKTVGYEDRVRFAAHQAMGGGLPLLCPIRATLEIALQIPTSWSKRAQARAADGVEHPTTKPDMDNVVKAVFDALNGIVWRDDVQVVQLAVRKHYSHTPGVAVTVETIPEWESP